MINGRFAPLTEFTRLALLAKNRRAAFRGTFCQSSPDDIPHTPAQKGLSSIFEKNFVLPDKFVSMLNFAVAMF
jgi:hypothetical protein